MIAILVPSRGRPEQLKRMIDSAVATSSTDIHFLIAYNDDEAESYTQCQRERGGRVVVSFYPMPDNLPTAHKWNLLADKAMTASFKLFMLGADDMIFATPCWDEALINHYNSLDKKQHVYHLQDSRDKDGTPHPIMTREWIEMLGYFVPPIFLHWYIDSWTVQLAEQNWCFTHLRDYELIHDKPSDKGNPDETHSRIRNWGWNERDKWVNDKLKMTYYGMECNRIHNEMYRSKH